MYSALEADFSALMCYINSRFTYFYLLTIEAVQEQTDGVPACLAGARHGAFTCDGWQVTLCDPIWQVTPRSCETT